MPNHFWKALGNYLRHLLNQPNGGDHLLKVLSHHWGLVPPDDGDPHHWAESVAHALAQKLSPRGRPRKDSQTWKQLELKLD